LAAITLSRSIERSDNTNPVTLQGGHNVVIDRVNNSTSEQTFSEDLRIRNNENIRERIPKTLEGKHTIIVTSSHVDKSTAKARGDGDTTLSDRNGSSDVPSRRRHSDIIPETREDEVEAPPAPVSPVNDALRLDDSRVSCRDERESFEELESYRHEDRFNDAIEERSYDERRSLLVTGRVLPGPTKGTPDRRTI
jgi:hypothetical protein